MQTVIIDADPLTTLRTAAQMFYGIGDIDKYWNNGLAPTMLMREVGLGLSIVDNTLLHEVFPDLSFQVNGREWSASNHRIKIEGTAASWHAAIFIAPRVAALLKCGAPLKEDLR